MPVAPAAGAVRTASLTIGPAARPEPALPARSRIPAITGAPVSVLIVVASGDRPLRSTCLPAILVCPKLAPCLTRAGTIFPAGLNPPTHRWIEAELRGALYSADPGQNEDSPAGVPRPVGPSQPVPLVHHTGVGQVPFEPLVTSLRPPVCPQV